jgi:hypothetical protein
MNILQQPNAFFSRDAPHHHDIGALSIYYPIYMVVHLGLARYVLNFDVVVRW